MASPFVFGDGYADIANRQMGLDQATTQRALASQQMRREVQRAAVAQRQQEIATQMSAQQQADYAAQREQENQYRMAAWMNQLQQQQRNYGLDREQQQYSRGRDVLVDAFKNKGYQADIDQNNIVNKLRQDEFGLRQDEFNQKKAQLTGAEIKDKLLREQLAAEDADKMQLANNMAAALNQMGYYSDAEQYKLPAIEDQFSKASWWGGRNAKYKPELYPYVPQESGDPEAFLKGKGFRESLALVQNLNKLKLADKKLMAETYGASGGAELVGQGVDGYYAPTYSPRINPVNQPTQTNSVALPPEVQAVYEELGSGKFNQAKYNAAIEKVRKAFPRKY